MGEIEGLWKLQNHNNTLKEIDKNLNEIANSSKIKALGVKLNRSEKKIIDLEKTIEEKEIKLNKGNSILKGYDYRLQEIEKNLYEGSITDLKQLTYLNQEREYVKNKIEDKELEILSQFQELEELKEEIISIKGDFNNLRKEYTEVIKEYKTITEDLKTKAIAEKNKIEEISLIINKEFLKKYNELIKTRGVAVVEVIDYRCSGCNMVLPAITIDRLKNNNIILYCENCDRMLYLKK